jgi:hypothetical protein
MGIGALAGLGAAATGLSHGINTGLKINEARRADVFANMMKGIMSDDDDAFNVAAAHFGMPLRKKKPVPGQMMAADTSAADNPAGQFNNIGAAAPGDYASAGLGFPARE